MLGICAGEERVTVIIYIGHGTSHSFRDAPDSGHRHGGISIAAKFMRITFAVRYRAWGFSRGVVLGLLHVLQEIVLGRSFGAQFLPVDDWEPLSRSLERIVAVISELFVGANLSLSGGIGATFAAAAGLESPPVCLGNDFIPAVTVLTFDLLVHSDQRRRVPILLYCVNVHLIPKWPN